jgi:homocysteine S-methyltransferase
LPSFEDKLFLSDGGVETCMVFHEGIPLPDFASFLLLETGRGSEAAKRYFQSFFDLAREYQCGLILETLTWRASRDWGRRLGRDRAALDQVNRDAVTMLEELRAENADLAGPVLISGCLGPRGDGYVPSALMTAHEAQAYHEEQIATFAGTAADLVSGMTLNYAQEAIGMTLAAKQAQMPVVISFTVETDGKLPTGQSLAEAIDEVDTVSSSYPIHYMINCAHPTHFEKILVPGSSWMKRICGIRANASKRSHAELNESADLDVGDPAELGREFAALKRAHPQLTVLGGCCGTDHRHVAAIASACRSLF